MLSGDYSREELYPACDLLQWAVGLAAAVA